MLNIDKEQSNTTILSHFKDHNRVWLYQSDRIFNENEVLQLQNEASVFASNWQSHGAPVSAAAFVMYNSLLVFVVDEDFNAPGGCSIDSSVRFVKGLEQKYNTQFFNRFVVAVHKGEERFEVFSLNDLKKEFKEQKIKDNDLIVNILPNNLGDFKENGLVPISKSWFFSKLK